MTKLTDLTTGQIQRIIAIKEQIEALQSQVDSIVADGGGGDTVPTSSAVRLPKKRRMSRAGRAAIAAAARARWIRIKGTAATASKPAKKRRKMSAAVKAKLAAIARARWAKVRKAGKTAL
jgi:hypothetical protein